MRLIVNRFTDTQTDWHIDKQIARKRKKPKTPTLCWSILVNAGLPDTTYLYYPLQVEGVSLKGTLLPVSIQQKI